MDELKKYIQQHKEAMDLEEPRPAVWNAVKDELDAKNATQKPGLVKIFTRWAVAASVLFLAGLGVHFLLKDPLAEKTVLVNAPKQMEPSTKQVPVTELKKEEKSAKQTIARANPKIEIQEINQTHSPYISMEEKKILSELESSFTQVINLQKDKLSTMPMYAESPDYFKDFKAQIRQLEKDEKTLKSDIIKHGLSDVLLDQLINLYHQKLSVLKQLQIEMNKTNNRYKQNRVPIDTFQTYFLNL